MVGGSVGEQLFVGHGWEHLAAAVAPAGVVGVDEPGDGPAGLVFGLEPVPGQQLVLERRVPALRRCVVQCGSDPAHRLGHPEAVARFGEEVADVLAALVRVKDHPVDVAATYGCGHHQRSPSDCGVVVLGHGEPGQAPGSEVQHDRQVQLALVGGDLGQVSTPALINRPGREVTADQVRDRRCGFVRAGQRPAFAFRRPPGQALSGHRGGDGVDRHLPARLDEVFVGVLFRFGCEP